MTSAIEAADQAGAETLAIMQAAPRYNRWQFRRIAPYLGRRVCEVGAGIGNMSALIAESGPEQLVLTDLDPAYREILQSRFAGSPNAAIEHLVLPDHSAAKSVSAVPIGYGRRAERPRAHQRRRGGAQKHGRLCCSPEAAP